MYTSMSIEHYFKSKIQIVCNVVKGKKRKGKGGGGGCLTFLIVY